MHSDELIAALTALGKRTRLEAFRLLVASEPKGLAAKDLGRLLGIRKHVATTHMASLAKAGLAVRSDHEGTTIYSANLNFYDEVTRFLIEDVRGGKT